MIEELSGLAQVVENLLMAIEQDAPEALELLFGTYGQYAQVLSAEGNHQYLADETFSLQTIALKMRQRLNQQTSGEKPRLSDASMTVLIRHLPVSRYLPMQVMKHYPKIIPQVAQALFLNPYPIMKGFDNHDRLNTSAEIIEALAETTPEMAQAILTRVIKDIPVHKIGLEFVMTVLSALPKLGPLDSEIRAAIHGRKKLLISTLGYMADQGDGEVANLPLIAKVHELALPELMGVLLHPYHMVRFEEKDKEGLRALISLDLPFDVDALVEFIEGDQRVGVTQPSFVTTLFLANPVLSIYDLAKAFSGRWESSDRNRRATYSMISDSVRLLKSMDLYDEPRACALIEELFLWMPEHELDESTACREFAKHLPDDLLKASTLMSNPAMARECLELDLGL